MVNQYFPFHIDSKHITCVIQIPLTCICVLQLRLYLVIYLVSKVSLANWAWIRIAIQTSTLSKVFQI